MNLFESKKELILRDYQAAAITDVRKSLSTNKRTVLVLPTGAGKTEIAVAIARMAMEKSAKSKVWFIVDRKTLAAQSRERFLSYGIKCGLLQGENTDMDCDDQVVVATVQTLSSRFDANPMMFNPDLIIIDEVHCLYETHTKLLEYRPVATIGLTATPENPSLGKWFTDMVSNIYMDDLIAAKHLVPFRAFAPNEPDVSKVGIRGGDFIESELEEAMSKITGDVVTHWKRLGENRRTIAFCVNVQHAREMAAQFNACGVPAEMVYAKTPDEERQTMYSKLRNGDLSVITSVLVLGVGFDLPEVSCGILARPTTSLALHVQQCGRVCRLSDGKDDALLLDHAGNTLRLGMPQHYRPSPLGEVGLKISKKQMEKERAAIKCSDCGAVMEPGIRACPNCGIEREITSDVVTVNGRLVERDAEIIGDIENSYAFKRQFFKELKGYGTSKGFSKGWPIPNYKNRYGNVPWHPEELGNGSKNMIAAIPCEETLHWISNQRKQYHLLRRLKSG
jgi:DNA repair protein RadD